ncbi:hypothetical protein At1D132_21230 [Agrobacterium fabrum]|nr:hypothetical protein At1D132_21230 [Agrobacterium fabrum]
MANPCLKPSFTETLNRFQHVLKPVQGLPLPSYFPLTRSKSRTGLLRNIISRNG